MHGGVFATLQLRRGEDPEKVVKRFAEEHAKASGGAWEMAPKERRALVLTLTERAAKRFAGAADRMNQVLKGNPVWSLWIIRGENLPKVRPCRSTSSRAAPLVLALRRCFVCCASRVAIASSSASPASQPTSRPPPPLPPSLPRADRMCAS